MFISLDLETTGFDPVKDKIIEFGAVKFDLEGNKEVLQLLINPGITLPQIITHITGITDEDLKDKPAFDEKAREIKEFIGEFPIIGHNIQFDTGFLRENGINLENPEYDTVQLSSILIPGLTSYSLEILSHTLDLKHKEKHRALDDAIAAMELFLKLADRFTKLSLKTVEKIHNLCKKSEWPLKKFLLTLNPKNSKSKTPEEPIKKPKKEKPPPNYYKSFLKTERTSLFQQPPPYKNLIKHLIEEIDKDSYISLPHQLFRQVEKEIPENIAKVDKPSSYISPKRLEEFQNKSFFENHEISALLKYIIWIQKTETGLLSEITLFGKEKETIPKININKNFYDLKEEKFFKKALKKDKDSPALCSHNFLIDQKPKIKDLILVDIEKFTKSLFSNYSIFLKLDILLNQLKELQEFEPNNQTIQSLSSKSTILFGLIGIIFEKFNDGNRFIKRTIVKEVEIKSKEWENVRKAVKNLIDTSKELKEIINDKTYPLLQNWKDTLIKLHEIFLISDIDNSTILIEEDFSKNIIIRKNPLSVNSQLKEIFSNCQNYRIISENLDLNDNAGFIKNLLGLPKNIPLRFGKEKKENIEIYITQDTPQNINTLINKLQNYLQAKKGKTAMIFNSKQQLNQFTLRIAPYLNKKNITTVSQLTGSLGKLREKFKQSPENSILFITPNFWDNFRDHELIDNLIIHKIPFDPPSDPFIVALSKNYEDPFYEFQIPRAVFSLKKMINRLTGEEKNKEVVILDPRLATKSYGKHFTDNLNNIARPNIINTANLHSIVKTNEQK